MHSAPETANFSKFGGWIINSDYIIEAKIIERAIFDWSTYFIGFEVAELNIDLSESQKTQDFRQLKHWQQYKCELFLFTNNNN